MGDPRVGKRTAVELLAPAGDREKMETALRFGADSVYLGGESLQLRAGNTGFSMEQLESAIEYAHGMNRCVYVAVNAFAFNQDFAHLESYARALAQVRADAVIVSDLGVLSVMRRAAPDLPVHISTQANCINYESARVYHDLGASRIVLGREMTIDQIAELRAKTPPSLELEAFVHGAMCMAYSGRCMISAHLSGRSANRGDCSQPCRWRYHLMEESRPGKYFPVEEDAGAMAILSAHDLNCVRKLDDLIQAGVQSLKIEGRVKSALYVGTVVNAYRHALDGSASIEEIEWELNAISHRTYSTGFYFDDPLREASAGHGYEQRLRFAAVVLAYEAGKAHIELRNRVRVGDTLHILSPDSLGLSFGVAEMLDEEARPVDAIVQPMQRGWVACPYKLSAGDILRVETDG